MAGNNTFAIDGINNAITGTKKEAAVAAIGKCTAIGCKWRSSNFSRFGLMRRGL